MKHGAAGHTVDGDTIDQVHFSGFLPSAQRAGEEAKRIRLYSGISQPSNVDADSTRRVHWHECYGSLWQLKVAFEKEHNRRVG